MINNMKMIRKRQQLKGGGNQQHKPMIRNKQGSQQKRMGGNHQYNRMIKRRCPSPTKNDDKKETTITNIIKQ
jgi:hypothetical protein